MKTMSTSLPAGKFPQEAVSSLKLRHLLHWPGIKSVVERIEGRLTGKIRDFGLGYMTTYDAEALEEHHTLDKKDLSILTRIAKTMKLRGFGGQINPTDKWTPEDQQKLQKRLDLIAKITEEVVWDPKQTEKTWAKLVMERVESGHVPKAPVKTVAPPPPKLDPPDDEDDEETTKTPLAPTPTPKALSGPPPPKIPPTSTNGTGAGWAKNLAPKPVPTDGVIKISELVKIRTDLIRPYKGQPRKHFDPDKIRALAKSIAKSGQSLPILVTRAKDKPQHFDIVDGERRWRSAINDNRPYVEAIIIEVKNDQDHFRRSFVANMGKEEHQDMEIARGIEKLRGFGDSNKDIAESVGKSEAWVANYLSLVGLDPRIQKRFEPGTPRVQKLSVGAGTQLSRLKKEAQWESLREAEKGGRQATAARVIRVVEEQIAAGKAKAGKNDVRPPRSRRPEEWQESMQTFLQKAEMFAAQWIEKDSEELRQIFASTSREELKAIRDKFKQIIPDLETIRFNLNKIKV